MFSGSSVAIITPFRNGSVDEEAFGELIEYQIRNRTRGIVPCGSTGESATLSYREHERVIELAVRRARGRVPVIAGTGSNSTAEAISLTRHARQAGADAALVIVPYYNKPTQRGLYGHFSAVARSVPIPMILYNIPSRTGVNLEPETLVRLATRHKNIVGVKESSGDLEQAGEIVRSLRGRRDFAVISGDDSLTLPILSVGGKGVISVLANIAPRDVAGLCSSFRKKDFARALRLHQKALPLLKTLFAETNPAPIKAAMEMLGFCSSEVRPPLCGLESGHRRSLARELRSYGLRRRG